MVKNLLVGIIPLALMVLCVVYVPGTQAKVSVVWAYLMGALQAALLGAALRGAFSQK